MRISCPDCNWEPTKNTTWECVNCGQEFPIFACAGICTQCDHRHQNAYCIAWEGGCGSTHPLVDWLADADQGLDELDIKKL